jgi:hypothetical protein
VKLTLSVIFILVAFLLLGEFSRDEIASVRSVLDWRAASPEPAPNEV